MAGGERATGDGVRGSSGDGGGHGRVWGHVPHSGAAGGSSECQPLRCVRSPALVARHARQGMLCAVVAGRTPCCSLVQ